MPYQLRIYAKQLSVGYSFPLYRDITADNKRLIKKQKNRQCDGSFVLREKVYEEMQDNSVSLIQIVFETILPSVIEKVCRNTE